MDRLLCVMSRWWSGWSLARMAEHHGIGRTRVRAILRRVGCVETLRSVDRRHMDSGRKPPAPQVQRAKTILSHPLIDQLTPRQLAAVAWTAQGLNSRDAAWRMGVAPQRVRALLVAAQRRLQRRTQRRHANTVPDAPAPTDLPALNWDGLLQSLTDPAVTDIAASTIHEPHQETSL